MEAVEAAAVKQQAARVAQAAAEQVVRFPAS
jgi:hypothetical protein